MKIGDLHNFHAPRGFPRTLPDHPASNEDTAEQPSAILPNAPYGRTIIHVLAIDKFALRHQRSARDILKDPLILLAAPNVKGNHCLEGEERRPAIRGDP